MADQKRKNQEVILQQFNKLRQVKLYKLLIMVIETNELYLSEQLNS